MCFESSLTRRASAAVVNITQSPGAHCDGRPDIFGAPLKRERSMKASLAPVRRPVPVGSGGTRKPLDVAFSGRGSRICGSGTEALAIALLDARLRGTATVPEAILPAYACPDLIAACLYAGVRPRLADTARGSWGYDLEALQRSLTVNCVAIVAVNLLGVGDQAVELRNITSSRGIALIQDSAQHLPRSLPADWPGDYVVLSFGRGKPLNLLGGGALLHPRERSLEIGSLSTLPATGALERPWFRRLTALAFNVATHPRVYGLARRLMGSSVGGTHYEPLDSLRVASAEKIAWVEHGLGGYEVDPGYNADVWASACAAWERDGFTTLSCASSTAPDTLRLRLAMLAPDRATRDVIVAALADKGLGATAMYGTTLERIGSVPEEVRTQGSFPHATDLAGRLFTLPTHSGVDESVVQRTQSTVAAALLSGQAA
jgi:dTDP-4-amino-4,6-dideoxygalactose transaminase